MRAEATLRFLPLTDGKTPLFMWLLIPLFKFFEDPLLAGRFLSVLAGFFTLMGVTFLGWRFFSRRVGLLAAFLYATTPFTVFFDRMALVDAMLSAFTIWSLNIALLLIKFPRIDLAMVLGYLLGGAWLTKTPGSFNLFLVPTTIVAFNWMVAQRQSKLVRLCGLWVIAIGISLVMYNLLRLGPSFASLSSRNEDYIFSPTRLLENPFDPFVPHIHDLTDWAVKLIGLPTAFLMLAGMIWALAKRHRLAIAVLLWAGLPLLVQMLLIKTFTARYILFSVPPIMVLAAWVVEEGLGRLGKLGRLGRLGLLGVLIIWPSYFNYYLQTDLAKVPLPANERRGYLEDWTAGYNLKDVASYLMLEASRGTIAVGTEGTFGTLPDGLMIYLDNYTHIATDDKRILLVPGKASISAELYQSASQRPTYFVANASRFPEHSIGVSLIKSYPKVTNPKYKPDAMLLFRVVPEKR